MVKRRVASVCVCVCVSVLFGLQLFKVFFGIEISFFYTQVRLQNIYVKVEYRGYGVKVKVIRAELNTHTWVVYLQLKGKLVECKFVG